MRPFPGRYDYSFGRYKRYKTIWSLPTMIASLGRAGGPARGSLRYPFLLRHRYHSCVTVILASFLRHSCVNLASFPREPQGTGHRRRRGVVSGTYNIYFRSDRLLRTTTRRSWPPPPVITSWKVGWDNTFRRPPSSNKKIFVMKKFFGWKIFVMKNFCHEKFL